ncbi:MAG: LamG-like jellyroll fold domain-containing protein [Candidatus Paceibacterota bacterium]|jgi:prepilin-type N-terminal cleavage/methylation domain-containing protein
MKNWVKKYRKTAFTLIELLVVIAIIGILSGLIVVSMSGVTQKANIAKAQVFSNSLKNSLMLNLISEWKLDEVIITTNPYSTPDSWSGGNIGNLYGSAGSQNLPQKQTSGCVSGNCFSFDGTDDYIDLGMNLTFPSLDSVGNSFSFSFWVYDNSSTSKRVFTKGKHHDGVSHDPQIIMDVGTSPSLIFRDSVSSSPYTFNTALNVLQWYNVTLSITRTSSDNTNVKIYVNGSLDRSADGVYRDYDVNLPLELGRYTSYTMSSVYFKGSIDDVRIYNAAISTSQIKEQYYAGLNNLLTNGGINKEEYLSKINNIAKE